jgi:Tripartite tricarboxylate transporter TctB family
MRPKSERDLVAGLLFVLVGIAFAWGATGYDFGGSANPGPGYVPFALGVLLVVLGGLVLFQAMSIETRDGERIGAVGWRPLLVVVSAVLLFAFGLPSVGSLLAVALTAFVATLATRETPWWQALALAVSLAVFCGAVFVGGLGLNLPLKPTPVSSWGLTR